MIYQPTQIILTCGKGNALKQLVSFEMALRDAEVAGFNLVKVSSILPPNVIPTKNRDILKTIRAGSIIYCVLSQCQSNENSRLISSAIGVAINKDKNGYGYISEHHSYGLKENECGKEAEDIAKEMLQTIQNNNDFDTTHISKDSIVENNEWTTVVSLAILI